MKVYHWRRAILDSDLYSTTRHVLLTLSCYFSVDGESAFPSMPTLAKDSGLSPKTIQTHISKAREAGWLKVRKHDEKGRKWLTNHYWATVPFGTKVGGAESEEAGEETEATGSRGGVTGARGGVTDGGRQGRRLPSNRTGKPSKESSNKENQDAQQEQIELQERIELPDWLPHAAWFAYLDMRNKKFRPLTGYAKRLVLATLQHFHEAGHDLVGILDTSTRNGWNDVYAPSKEEKPVQKGSASQGKGGGRYDRHDRSAAAAAIFGTEDDSQIIEVKAVEVNHAA